MKEKLTRLTPWFSPKTIPKKIGVYQVKPKRCAEWWGWYSFFDGSKWMGTASNPARAVIFGKEYGPTSEPDLKWRGLAEKP